MNRGRTTRWLAAAAAAACAVPAAGQAGPETPTLSIEQVTSSRFLGDFDLAKSPTTENATGSLSTGGDRVYRLDPPPIGATGKRAKLSVALGKSTLFAIAGKVNRSRARPTAERAAGVAPRQSNGGKVYGAGIERRVGKFELGAVYQYSKIGAEQPDTTSATRLRGGDKSHNLRATVRVRFRP